MKRIICLVLALLIQFSVMTAVKALGFTHPEIGELIEFTYRGDLPSFAIYGFTQYMLLSPESPYRGLKANLTNPLDSNMLSLDKSLRTYFESIEGRTEDEVPVVFEYTGILKEYTQALDALPVSERINAIKLLSGFEGPTNFSKLLSIPGFEDVAASFLEDGYTEYTVDIKGKSYPYRVLMFYIEEDDWEQVYYERFCYIKVKNEWKLFRISKEYFSEYRQRPTYIQGFPGSNSSELQPAFLELTNGIDWHMIKDQISIATKSNIIDEKLDISDVTLYRLPADLGFSFDGDWLSSITYTFKNSQSYNSAFVSLYIRFYDPIAIESSGTVTWSLPDTLIQLIYDDEHPSVVITPRIDLNELSAG